MKIGKIEIDKKIFNTLVVVIIITIISLLLKHFYVNRYQKYKIDKDKDYIYTLYKNNTVTIPYININTKEIEKINDELSQTIYIYENNIESFSNTAVEYQYNVSGQYVSLVIIFKSIKDNKLIYDYDTYVFDLENKGKLLSQEEILNLFNKNEEDINTSIEKDMKKKYNYEIEQSILPQTCDYTCFLSLRNIKEYTDEIKYYIEDKSLVAFRNYNVYSNYNEEDYYTRDDFKFYIK